MSKSKTNVSGATLPTKQKQKRLGSAGKVHLVESNWWNDLMEGVYGPRQGGARIIVDSEGASTGVGKTGLAVYIAELLSNAFDYSLQPEDMTLSGSNYLDRWREHPDADQPSVLILDELGGAGAGHARRAMANQNVELGNAWQLMRKKRIVSIVTLPHWSKADKHLRQQADYRLWCREKPIGYFQPYKVGCTFSNGNIQTKSYDDVDRLAFPNLDANDSKAYRYLSDLKDELLNSEFLDADKLQEDEEDEDDSSGVLSDQDKKHIKHMAENSTATQGEIAEAYGIDNSTVSKIKTGEY